MTTDPPPTGLAALRAAVHPVDEGAAGAARERHAGLATPPGALGALEELGARLAAIAGSCPPPVPARPALVIAAGDHGVHAREVTPWPKAVTGLMVRTFCAGRATANAFADVVGADVAVVDVGVASAVDEHPRLRRSRVRDGTADLATGPATTTDEAVAAVLAGAAAADAALGDGADLLVTGDMGIANTTPAAALIAAFTAEDPAVVTGRGTGIDDPTLARKIAAVRAAVERHRDDEPLQVLAGCGGLEHAALVGVVLAGAAARMPVLLDGVSAGAAALAAVALAPAASGYLVAGQRSTEPGATRALAELGLTPLIDLGLRLGEGTGALLAIPVVRAAAAALSRVATLDEVLAG